MEPNTIFPEQGLIDFVKAAYSGANAYLFIALNLIALHLYRRYAARWAFAMAALASAFMGALTSLIETQAKTGIGAGTETVLLHAVLAGAIISAASSLVIGYGILLTVQRIGLQTLPTNGPLNGAAAKGPEPPPDAPKSG